MTIIIESPSDVEETIRQEAAREGVTPQEYILQAAIEKARAAASVRPQPVANGASKTMGEDGPTYAGFPIGDNATLALFAQWEAEDPVTSPEDLAERQREGDEITAAIQANRFNIPRDPILVSIVESMSRDEDAEEDNKASA